MNLQYAMVTATLMAFLLVNGIAQQARSKEDQVMSYLLSAPMEDVYSRIRSMTEDEKAAVMRVVRENKSGRWSYMGSDKLRIFLLLGDPEQRRAEIENFRRIRSNRYDLVNLGEPWVIEELAPEMFREEEYKNLFTGDVYNPQLSYAVAGLIIANLQNATIYRDEVRQWARRNTAQAIPELRDTMREWWRANERHFKEKNYRAVQPGPQIVWHDEKGQTRRTPTEGPNPPDLTAENAVRPPSSPPPSSSVPATPVPVSVIQPVFSTLHWAGLAAAIAVMVGLLLFWKCRN